MLEARTPVTARRQASGSCSDLPGRPGASRPASVTLVFSSSSFSNAMQPGQVRQRVVTDRRCRRRCSRRKLRHARQRPRDRRSRSSLMIEDAPGLHQTGEVRHEPRVGEASCPPGRGSCMRDDACARIARPTLSSTPVCSRLRCSSGLCAAHLSAGARHAPGLNRTSPSNVRLAGTSGSFEQAGIRDLRIWLRYSDFRSRNQATLHERRRPSPCRPRESTSVSFLSRTSPPH